MSQDLFEIPVKDWTKLRDLYAIEHKKSPCGYGLLQNYITWHEKEPDMPFKIYSLNGNWAHDGTFIIEDIISQSSLIHCNTLGEDLTSLTNALNCLHTSLPQVFCGLPERILPALRAHATHVGVAEVKFNPSSYIWYHLPKADALEFVVSPPEGNTLKRLQVCHAEQVNSALPYHYPCSIDYVQRLIRLNKSIGAFNAAGELISWCLIPPEGMTIRRLEVYHAEQVNRIWPYNFPDSISYVQRMIRLNESIGAFNATGELLAWCLISPLGALGLLQVEDNAKRRGLGSLMVRYLSKRIAIDDMEVMAPVNPTNQASRSMFEKLGFRQIDQLYWYIKFNKEISHEWSNHKMV